MPTKDRDPSDHSYIVGGPEGNGANEKKNDLPFERANMERKKIGDGKTDY